MAVMAADTTLHCSGQIYIPLVVFTIKSGVRGSIPRRHILRGDIASELSAGLLTKVIYGVNPRIHFRCHNHSKLLAMIANTLATTSQLVLICLFLFVCALHASMAALGRWQIKKTSKEAAI